MAFLQRMAAVGRALPRQARGVAAEALREPPPLGVTFREVNKCEFKIIDSTLREGEQFDTCTFNTHDRIYIAKMLDKLGVDYIEMLNPVASQQAFEDCRTLADLDMQRAKILTHIRCDMRDVEAAVESGVHGVNMYMATSEILVQHSHKKGIDEVLRLAEKAITYVKKHGLECRFSCEDTFRSNMNDVLKVYTGVAEMGVDRVGIADTVGIATPLDAYRVVGTVKAALPEGVGIEFHAHDDTGCCLANALMAVEAGATHIDTCVLGIGERNGIVNLGGLLGPNVHPEQREDPGTLQPALPTLPRQVRRHRGTGASALQQLRDGERGLHTQGGCAHQGCDEQPRGLRNPQPRRLRCAAPREHHQPHHGVECHQGTRQAAAARHCR
eukprot:Sspe_Gene.56592::Locus_31123_Transcript_1_2_Confidence_0.750_Length_1921::g.56592::m.56592/K01655/LYS21, LYS20; homocitrate synthase